MNVTERQVDRDLGAIDVEQLADDTEDEWEDEPDLVAIGIEHDPDESPPPPTWKDEEGGPLKDGGDLYGLWIGFASDRRLVDDDDAFKTGQNWTESLEEHAAEGGPEPEHRVDIVDEDDVTNPSTDSRDRPIADRGSGGLRGM